MTSPHDKGRAAAARHNMPDPTPDSQVNPDQDVIVFDTPSYDNPSHGSVTVEHQQSKHNSTSIRISRATAASLLRKLAAYLGQDCETCGGYGEVGRMTIDGGESDICPTCAGLGAHL